MKKISCLLTVVMIVVVMVILTRCGKGNSSSSENKIDNSTPEKLIESFFNELKNGSVDKAKKFFNTEAMAACEIVDEDMNIEFEEAYDMMFNLDQGVEYFENNYENFVEELEKIGEKLDEDLIDELSELVDSAEDTADEMTELLYNIAKKTDAKIESIEKDDSYKIDLDNLFAYEVKISYEDDTETVNILVVEADDEYYIFGIE